MSALRHTDGVDANADDLHVEGAGVDPERKSMNIVARRDITLSQFTDDEIEYLYQIGNYCTAIAEVICKGEAKHKGERGSLSNQTALSQFLLRFYDEVAPFRRKDE